MDERKMEYHLRRLNQGEIYWDKVNKQEVEFGYMGMTGYAIVYEPGDSGGGMQSSWGVNPENLVALKDKPIKKTFDSGGLEEKL